MKRNILAFFIIVILAIFMRFYNIFELFHWTMDEEYWSYIPLNIATGYHFPLIGGSMADVGVYTTPWFVYFMSIVAFIGKGNPLVFGLFTSSLGVLTVILIYVLGKRIFSEKVALFASFIYSISLLASFWDRHYWNASLTPLLTLLTFYFLYKKRLIFLALTLALAISAHGTGITLFLFSTGALVFWRRGISLSKYLIAGAIFCLSFSPLVWFEARHNFLQTKALLNYFTVDRSDSQSFGGRLISVGEKYISVSGKIYAFADNNDVASQLTLGDKTLNRGEPKMVSWIIVSLVIIYLGLNIKKLELNTKLLLLQISVTFLGLLIFRSPMSDYYFSPTVIPLVFLTGLTFESLWKRRLGRVGVVLILATLIYLNTSKLLVTYHSSSYPKKLSAVQNAISLVNNEPFAFNARCIGHCQLYGFRYLFTYLGHEPVSSYMDPYFSWLYEEKLSRVEPTREVNFEITDDIINTHVQKI